ncbi:MAG: c-type cytochrome [Acidimicrobiia bacterium]
MRGSFLALVFTVVVAACAAPTTTPPAPTPTQAPATQPPATAAPATEAATTTAPPTTAPDPAALGKSLAARNGCTACHSPDGAALVGPTWKGLFGKEETLGDGSTVLVDEAYLRESIVDPNAKIVQGYAPNIMPQDFGTRLSDEEIDALIAYIKTLD